MKDEIKKATQSEGYLILITRKNGDKLKHSFFTRTFPKKDIPIVLWEYEQMLKKEYENIPKI